MPRCHLTLQCMPTCHLFSSSTSSFHSFSMFIKYPQNRQSPLATATLPQPHPFLSFLFLLFRAMSTSGEDPPMGAKEMEGAGEPIPPGKPMTMEQHIVDKGAMMLQRLKPMKQISQHGCSFAIYSHDMTRQIETHHYCTRINQDFLQCAVYDSDGSHGRLIGVEYIVSDKTFEALPPDEQKLWHSHAYEIKSGLWVNPRVPEVVVKPELENLAKSYGKFWCTWQLDRGDRLPIGPPALMVSPQGVNMGVPSPELVRTRDLKYNILTEAIRDSRVEIAEPEWLNPMADYWKQHGKGFKIGVEPVDMKLRAPFP